MASTIAAWRDYVAQIRVCRKAIELINGQGLRLQGAAFRPWIDWSKDQAHSQRIIAKAVARLRHGTLIRIWAAWTEFASESKEKRKAIARQFVQVS